MFSRKYRLSRTAFPGALKGRRVSSPNFSAVVSKDAEGYAVVVSKKTARLSVTRHRLKRRTLEALKTITLPSESLILFPKASVAHMTHEDICAELERLLSKIR